MSAFQDTMKKWKERYRVGIRRWSGFMERQGFYVMLGVCVAVIIGSAIWTRSSQVPVIPPETLNDDLTANLEAGSEAEFVQRMSDVNWVTSQPDGSTIAPLQDAAVMSVPDNSTLDHPQMEWPLKGDVLRTHSDTVPVFLPTLGVWATHDGIDIAAKVGDPVHVVLSGTISAAYEDPLLGNVIEVQHPGGFTTRYAGLSTLELLKVGDPVKTGQLLAPLGQPIAVESEDPPHLHFEILRDGKWVDPMEYLLKDSPE